jgi:hypothetical protein
MNLRRLEWMRNLLHCRILMCLVWTIGSSLSIRIHHTVQLASHGFLMNYLLSCWLPTHNWAATTGLFIMLHYDTSRSRSRHSRVVMASTSACIHKWGVLLIVLVTVFREFCCQLLTNSSKFITHYISASATCIIGMMRTMLSSELLSDLVTHLSHTLLWLHLMGVSRATNAPIIRSHIEYL